MECDSFDLSLLGVLLVQCSGTELGDVCTFSCPDGNATFSLSHENEVFENKSVIYFEHEHLDELHKNLSQKGIQFLQPPIEQIYLWKEAILKDPSGNKIKLYWAGENRLNPPWKVEIRE